MMSLVARGCAVIAWAPLYLLSHVWEREDKHSLTSPLVPSAEERSGVCGGRGILPLLAFVAVILIHASTPAATASSTLSYEKYGTTSTGVDLYWTAYVPSDGLRHPAVIVLHPGGYKAGDAGPLNVAEDLGNAGFLALAVEYRLAPPHDPMDSPTHPVPGQNDVSPVDDGHYPEQTNDVQLAIRTARADPRCNGLVYCIGGSAGGSHTAYMATTGSAGDDMPDLVAIFSCGVSNLFDPNLWPLVCNDTETCPSGAIANYLDITNSFPLPPSGAALATAQAASPVTHIHPGMPPMFILCSDKDSLGIPTSTGVSINSYNTDGTIGPLEIGTNGLIPNLLLGGFSESTSNVPVADTFKKAIVPVAGHSHAFEYWSLPFDGIAGHPTVATTVINWLKAGPPGSGTLPTKNLLNVSTRTDVLGGDGVLIGGFIISGHVAKSVVLRGLGPSLAGSGVIGFLADPTLELYDSTNTLVAQNDNWSFPLPDYVIAGDLIPKNPAESLIATTLPPGSYTVVLRGANDTAGVALFELYDVDAADSEISNLSTRGRAENGDQGSMIGGFIIGGTEPTEVLVRGLGPSLTKYGVLGALPDPVLEIHNDQGSLVGVNDNWRSNQQQQIIDTGIPPSDDKESAIVSTLVPGNYTALVYGAHSSQGIALVEVYNLTGN
jgi:acetyl esterase/lipase